MDSKWVKGDFYKGAVVEEEEKKELFKHSNPVVKKLKRYAEMFG